MKNGIQSIGARIVTTIKLVAIVAVMSFAVPAFNGPSVASAQAGGIEQVAVWVGPIKICIFYCFVPGYCCEVEGLL